MSILHNKSSTLVEPKVVKIQSSQKNSFPNPLGALALINKIQQKRAQGQKRQKQDLLNKGSLFDRLSCSCLPYLEY